ncbi:MAG TPA: thioredoxin family protein [Chthoniobacterales bacterium]
MKTHLIALTITLGIGFLLPSTSRAESGWETDLKKAQEQAKASNKLVFLNFTGSDWCGWCIRLDKEILSKPAFKEYATKNLVLVEVDFPRRKDQSLELKKQNQGLAEQYQVQGFPTIVMLNGSGQKVWRYDGYFAEGPEAFIAELEKARKG